MSMNQFSHDTFRYIHDNWPWLEVEVYNIDSLPAVGLPALVIPHHQRFMDIFVTTMCIDREVRYMAKKPLFMVPVLGWYLRQCGAFPVQQEKPDRAALRQATKLLADNELVCVYAEGHRHPGNVVFPVQPGILKIVKDCQHEVPIYPIGISYRQRGIRLSAIFVVGTPFYLGELGDISRDDMAIEVQARMQLAQNEAVRLSA